MLPLRRTKFDAIDRGLIHRLDDGGQILAEFALVDTPHDVSRSIAPATCPASGASSSAVPRNSSKARVIARISRWPVSAIRPSSAPESTPAERKIPTSTSASRWARTLSSTAARRRSPSSAAGAGSDAPVARIAARFANGTARAGPPYRSAACARPARRECRGRA